MKQLLFYTIFLVLATTSYASIRIVGGANAPPGKYPYQVSLRYRHRNFTHGCGGSIINNRWTLTATHCVLNDTDLTKPLEPKDIRVLLGTTKLNGEGGQTYLAEYIAYRREYNTYSRICDIALIRVDRDIKFNKKVQPIKLPKKDFTKTKYPAVLSGWGRPQAGEPHPNDMQEITLKVIEQSECEQAWKGNVTITESHICTLTKVGEGICYGDSGGPLVADGVQIGVVSITYYPMCARGKPDVYTRVYIFLSWINEEIANYKRI